jgi:hypothetical protein
MWGFAVRSLTSGESLGPVITFVVLVVVLEWQVYGLLRRRPVGALKPPQDQARESLSSGL